jgi:hypothetical protein
LLFSVKFGGHYGNCKDHPLFFLCICRSHFQLKFFYRESSLPVQAFFWVKGKALGWGLLKIMGLEWDDSGVQPVILGMALTDGVSSL